MFDRDRPYNDLPRLPPAEELESRAVLKLCIEAHTALADLKRIARQIPNQSVLTETIPTLEAQASSEIENVVTTSDALFKSAKTNAVSPDPATREALRYRDALRRGFEMIQERPSGVSTAVEICTMLRNVEAQVRRVPGTRVASSSGNVIYTPPEGESLLHDLLGNWERFMHEADSIDVLVRMAVGHYQFEAIHPFIDGNGRTGRILNVLFICEQGLLDQPILHLSRHINKTRSGYYDGLLAVTTDNRWEDWICYIVEGVRDTARWTVRKAEALISMQAAAANVVKSREPKIHSYELVETIFRQPYSRIADLVGAGIAERQTASEYLKRLRDVGLLEEIAIGREKLFLNREMRDLLVGD